MSEADMIDVLLSQVTSIRSVRKIFMKKRDVTVYDDSWDNVSELRTEYDIDIIAQIIEPGEWNKLVKIEKYFCQKYPKFKFNYNLIESESNLQTQAPNAKLVYDSEGVFN